MVEAVLQGGEAVADVVAALVGEEQEQGEGEVALVAVVALVVAVAVGGAEVLVIDVLCFSLCEHKKILQIGQYSSLLTFFLGINYFRIRLKLLRS